MTVSRFSVFAISCLVLLLVVACAAPAAPAPAKSEPPQSKPAAAPQKATAPEKAPAPAPPKSAPAAAPSKPAAQPKASAPAKIRVAVMRGQQIFPIMVMEDLGLDKKYGFVLDKKVMASPTAIVAAIRAKEVEAAFNGWVEAVKFRAQGIKNINAYPLSIFVNAIVARSDSPLKGMEDLKGRNFGTFYQPGSITSGIIQYVGSKFYGFDPYEANKLQQGAKPLLIGLLDKGDVDAIYLSEPELAKMMASGKYKTLLTIKEVYATKAKTDVPFQLAVVLDEDWADKNLDLAKGYVAAMQESVRYIKANPGVWKKLAAEVEIEEPKAADLLRQSVGDGYVGKPWDAKYIAATVEFGKEVRKILGPDFLPDTDYSTAFTSKYAPAN